MSKNNDGVHNSEEVLNILDGEVKTYSHLIAYVGCKLHRTA
jgi:hypothetical protein